MGAPYTTEWLVDGLLDWAEDENLTKYEQGFLRDTADALIEAERRGAERMRERAASRAWELWNDAEAEISPDYIANGISALPLTEETPDADA